MKKTILVTGGAGFIGSHLVDQLVNRGDKVVVVDDFNNYYSPKIKENNLKTHRNKENFKLYRADIRKKNTLNNIFSKYKFDAVAHLAARAGVRPSILNPTLYTEVNVLGTINILELVKKHTVPQLVFASSSSVYGNLRKGVFKEIYKTDQQISPYGTTKKSGELFCQTYAHLYGIKITVLRLFTVYGPRNRPDMACYKFLNNILNDKPIVRFGKGNTSRDYTYIEDVINGMIRAIDKPFKFEIINLGNSSPVKLNKLIKEIEKVVHAKAKIIERPLQSGDVNSTCADIRKAKKILDYNPQKDLKKGLSLLLKWYKNNGLKK